jgi:hypothetical protein
LERPRGGGMHPCKGGSDSYYGGAECRHRVTPSEGANPFNSSSTLWVLYTGYDTVLSHYQNTEHIQGGI